MIRPSIALALLFITAQSHSAPVYYTAEDILPGGLGTIQTERSDWASAQSGTLATEGFESLVSAPPAVYDFGDFTMSFSGGSLSLYGSNNLTRTEGVQGLGFSGDGTVTFTFDNTITAFGIDWSSFDLTSTVISYSDDNGGLVSDIFQPVTSAGAGFFGVINTDGFSTVTFAATSSEILEFDFIQYSSEVPSPAPLALLGLGLAAIGWTRRKTA